jgi:hypothetical protein
VLQLRSFASLVLAVYLLASGYPFSFNINQRANEDLSYFGPLGALLVLPLVAVFPVLAARRRATLAHAAHALSLPLYLVALALAR